MLQHYSTNKLAYSCFAKIQIEGRLLQRHFFAVCISSCAFWTGSNLCANPIELHNTDILCAAQATDEEEGARRYASVKSRIQNKATCYLPYPEPECMHKLSLTQCTAKELVLLAELAGWEPFVPAMLDMATRPENKSSLGYSYGLGGSGISEIMQLLAGFRALRILSSSLQTCHAATAVVSQCQNTALFDAALICIFCCCYMQAFVS